MPTTARRRERTASYYIVTLPDGSTASARALAYYRLIGGRIVVNDVMFDPDLMPVLGPLTAPTG